MSFVADHGGARRALKLLGRVGEGRWLALVLLFVLITLRVANPSATELLQVKFFDLLQNIKPREAMEQSPVVIVDIDERSLSEIGQWPWSRLVIADIVGRLTDGGARAIGFDVVFPEPDRQSPTIVADALRQAAPELRDALRRLPSNEAVLSEALRNAPVVLGQAAYTDEVPGAENRPPPPTVPIGYLNGDAKQSFFAFASLVRNVRELEQAAAGVGIFSVRDERDGVIRRVPSFVRVGDALFPSLSLEMLRVATGQTTYAVRRGRFGVEGVIIPQVALVPTDAQGRIWVGFSPHDPSRYISAVDLLNGRVPPERLAGRLVLVGTSAIGLKDIRRTPVDVALPGVEVHANLLETIITGSQLTRPLDADGTETALALAVGLMLILLVPLVGPFWTLAVFVVTAGGVVGWSWYAYAGNLELRDASMPLAIATLVYLFLVFANYIREANERRQVRGAFAQYLSPALVEQLASNPKLLKLGGETKEMTIMFSDIRKFTQVSEQFKTNPQALTQLINRFLTPMSEAILAQGGTIDKFMGDCVMAFWNAPLDDPRHPDHACAAALEMQKVLRRLNIELDKEAKEQGWPFDGLKIGIGVNTGDCVVGNVGSLHRFDYSVLGDSVNLASRLEGQSKSYGITIILGEQTVQRAGKWAFLELDMVTVKGKKDAVRIYTLLGDAKVAESQRFLELWTLQQKMLAAYRSQRWQEAREVLEAARAYEMEFKLRKYFNLFAARIDAYEKFPPGETWDGIYLALAK